MYSLSLFGLMFIWVGFFKCFKPVDEIHDLEVVIIENSDES